jgi:HPt (histidine-containing phosphotransfer) domain-containing protein
MQAVAERIAFNSPSGEMPVPSHGRPIDLVHLAKQSGGDRHLETEILSLFRQQIAIAVEQLRRTSGRERKIIAHTIKGSARAVGAVQLARLAGRLEETLTDNMILAAIETESARIRDFICALDR